MKNKGVRNTTLKIRKSGVKRILLGLTQSCISPEDKEIDECACQNASRIGQPILHVRAAIREKSTLENFEGCAIHQCKGHGNRNGLKTKEMKPMLFSEPYQPLKHKHHKNQAMYQFVETKKWRTGEVLSGCKAKGSHQGRPKYSNEIMS
jgi:hypothetical protein